MKSKKLSSEKWRIGTPEFREYIAMQIAKELQEKTCLSLKALKNWVLATGKDGSKPATVLDPVLESHACNWSHTKQLKMAAVYEDWARQLRWNVSLRRHLAPKLRKIVPRPDPKRN